jgi:hypothetical protein
MKISGIGGAAAAGSASKTAKTAKSAAGGFAENLASLDQGVEESQAVDTPAAVGGIAALLVTQGVGDSLERETRRRLVRYGEDLLDMLEELRHGLLLGAVPKEKLIAMAQMVRGRRDNVADPVLTSLLDDIELRVEVELAKLSPRDR